MTAILTAHLPVTVEVALNGAVSIESPTRVIGMSTFSPRAERLTLDLGRGTHVLRTEADVEDLPTGVADDITEALV